MDDIPDLIDSDSYEDTATVSTLSDAITDIRIRTRQKFHSFFEENFKNLKSYRKIDYDYDSIIIVHPSAKFLRPIVEEKKFDSKKRKPVEIKPEIEEKCELEKDLETVKEKVISSNKFKRNK